VFVIGGAQLYAEALPLADELLLTEVDADLDGDTRFPSWNRGQFDVLSRQQHTSAQGLPFTITTYRRRPG
jgi:dihydrofolate reductase